MFPFLLSILTILSGLTYHMQNELPIQEDTSTLNIYGNPITSLSWFQLCYILYSLQCNRVQIIVDQRITVHFSVDQGITVHFSVDHCRSVQLNVDQSSVLCPVSSVHSLVFVQNDVVLGHLFLPEQQTIHTFKKQDTLSNLSQKLPTLPYQ